MTVVILTIGAALLFIPAALLPKILGDAAATALYVPNLAFALQGTDYLAETAPSPFQHYWSLGIEEQFYLVWPVALLLLWRVFGRGRGRRALLIAVGTLVAVSLLGAIILTFRSQPWAFFSLPTRAWELGVGALIALLGEGAVRRVRPVWAMAGSWVGLGLVVAAVVSFDASTPFPGYAAIVPVVGTALVVFFGQAPTGRVLLGVLGNRTMQWIGLISYSLYLVHWPLLVIPAATRGSADPLPLVVTLLLGLLSVPLAWLLYHLVEEPMRERRGGRRIRPRVILAIALVLSVVVAAGALGLARIAEAQPAHSGSSAREITSLDSSPEFTGYVPSNLTPSIQDAKDDIPAIYASECHLGTGAVAPQACTFGPADAEKSVALFGDSHAASWFPALMLLAEREGFRLDVYTKSSCPSVEIPILTRGTPYVQCDAWRGAVLEKLALDPPDLVVMSNLANHPEQGEDFSLERWTAGVESVVARLEANSTVVLISDTPAFPETPAICLSVHVEDTTACDAPTGEAIDAEWAAAEALAAEEAGARVIDMNDYFCNDELCGPIIGATLVYRDATHFTATFSTKMADPLWDQLNESLN
jgi:peptidoglycan/LPS O-acetylase OafA/YrhL